MFVATDDLRAPIQNQETPWLDSWKKTGYATPLQIEEKLWECCKHDQIPKVHRSDHNMDIPKIAHNLTTVV
jgi:hypothetical protein